MFNLLGNVVPAVSGLAAPATPLLAHAADFLEGGRQAGDATFGWMILLAPLAGALIIGLGYRVLSDRLVGWIGTTAIFVAFAASIGALVGLLGMDVEERHILSGYQYAKALGVEFNFDIYIDPLSVFMCLVVTGVSALIHLYSIAYMRSDRGYCRFFSYLNFFVFSMLLLVLAGNLALLIVGWAFVGAASYLLISFWYRRRTATAAGIKAFVINVLGDVGIVLGSYLLWSKLGTLSIPALLAQAQDPFAVAPSATFTAAALLLLVGAFAKSAQVPLHTWLPDAMEGPTPVSALIHAATMVTAGVYLIARMHPFFEISQTAAITAGVLGAVTLLVAATTALVQTDLKRIIAYSTMSQIGYMIVGVSAAAYSAGLFHLMTHAFFKALLFMAAGSVIAAMGGIQDIRKMGGFRKALPFTYAVFVIGALALAGFPLLSGFFSKDEIISFTLNRGGAFTYIGIAALIGAVLTAFYSIRAVFLVFHGDTCEPARELEGGHLHHGGHVNPSTGEHEDTEVGFPGADHHIAEREPEMKIAMSALALLSIVAGAAQIPGVTHVIGEFLHPVFAESRYAGVAPSTANEYAGLAIGAAIAVAGIGFGIYAYGLRRGMTARLAIRMRGAHSLLTNAWYFDAIIERLAVRPIQSLATFFNGGFERFVASGIPGAAGGMVRGGAHLVRSFQTGITRVYAGSVILGATVIALYFYVVAR